MKPVWSMVGVSVTSWLAAAIWVETDTGVAMLFGMLGPLAIATGTWWLTARTYRRNPGQVTSLMVGAFAGKLVLVGAYVAFMLRGLSLRPVPFVASFTSYFIALYVMEALYLRRLFAGGLGSR